MGLAVWVRVGVMVGTGGRIRVKLGFTSHSLIASTIMKRNFERTIDTFLAALNA